MWKHVFEKNALLHMPIWENQAAKEEIFFVFVLQSNKNLIENFYRYSRVYSKISVCKCPKASPNNKCKKENNERKNEQIKMKMELYEEKKASF